MEGLLSTGPTPSSLFDSRSYCIILMTGTVWAVQAFNTRIITTQRLKSFITSHIFNFSVKYEIMGRGISACPNIGRSKRDALWFQHLQPLRLRASLCSAVCSVKLVLCIVQFKPCSRHHAVFSVKFPMCSVHRAMCSVLYSVCRGQYKVWSVHCMLCSVRSVMYNVRCLMHSMKCVMYSLQCAM